MSEPAIKRPMPVLVPPPSSGPDEPKEPRKPAAAEAAKPENHQFDDLFPAEALEKKSWVALARANAAKLGIAALALVAVFEFALIQSKSSALESAAELANVGTLQVESIPPGATIVIDGQERGVTPATISMGPGKYTLALKHGEMTRSIPLVIREGYNSERIYFDEAAKPEGRTATDNIASAVRRDPSAPSSTTPPPAAALPAGAVGGWLTIVSPVELELSENGSLIGSSHADRIMLPVGRHVIEASNPTLGFKTSTTVQITAGSVTRMKPEIPNGTLNINATPWAEVSVDGKPLGATPIGNVPLAIGAHELVFTHPQLGERRETVIVNLNGVNRVAVNFNQR